MSFKSFIYKILSLAGYNLIKVPKGTSKTFRAELERFESFGSLREWQQIMLYGEVFTKIIDIPGDIAEFGVSTGTSFKAFLRFTEILNKSLFNAISKKSVYGFDTFEGLPELTLQDNSSSNVTNKKGDFESLSTLDNLRKFVELYSCGEIIKGDFRETLKPFIEKYPHTSFSLIHIDCDIYSSTNYVLETIAKRLSIGGIILFDEIFHKNYPGETQGFLDFYNNLSSSNEKIKLDFKRSVAMPWKWYCIRIE